MLFLIIPSGVAGTPPQRLPLDDGAELSIGRSPESAVLLAGDQVSRRHAVLRCESGQWLVADLGSTFGTHLNGRKLTQPAALKDGDLIQVGGHELRVVDGNTAHPGAVFVGIHV